MGKKGRAIVEVDIKKLLGHLEKAYADEWIAYYAYKWAADVAHGLGSPEVAELADKIADEEEEHADELGERILELGGTLPYGIEKLHGLANCKTVNYPKDMSNVKAILKGLVEAEGCAIDVYNKIVKFLGPCYDKDIKTFHVIQHVLAEEIKHEEQFENLL